jgi:hypothetical protein
MDRLPATSFFITDHRLLAGSVGRRSFLKGCGLVGLAVSGIALAGCESAGEIKQVESQQPTGFFADGTDFAD